MPLQPGDAAPDVTLPSAEKQQVALPGLWADQPLVLMFFPLAFTSTCTEELCTVRDDIGSYEGLNARVAAVSALASPLVAPFGSNRLTTSAESLMGRVAAGDDSADAEPLARELVQRMVRLEAGYNLGRTLPGSPPGQGEVTVEGLGKRSLQGDVGFADYLFGTKWTPLLGGEQQSFGVVPLLFATFYITAIALVVAVYVMVQSLAAFERARDLVDVVRDVHDRLARLAPDLGEQPLAPGVAVVGQVRDAVAQEVGTEAADEFLRGFASIHTNLADAVDGADRLLDWLLAPLGRLVEATREIGIASLRSAAHSRSMALAF